jgi:hypothetical protein
MKKWVIGCLGVLLICGVVGIGGMWYAYHRAKEYVSGLTQFGDIPKIEEQVSNKASYSEPPNGELTADQVDRFMKVQEGLETKMGARLKELDTKYQALSKANGGKGSITETFGAISDLGSLIVEAKHTQVELLNANHFSVSEYNWTRQSIYSAIGVPMTGNFTEALKKAAEGHPSSGDTPQDTIIGVVPEHNKQLVAPHAEKLRERAGWAFFGL